MPAGSYEKLKKNVTTYAMFLLALFGEKCPHYGTVWCIRRQLQYLENKSENFSDIYCREITWAIIVDARHFFDQRLVKNDFRGPDVD